MLNVRVRLYSGNAFGDQQAADELSSWEPGAPPGAAAMPRKLGAGPQHSGSGKNAAVAAGAARRRLMAARMFSSAKGQ